MSARPVTILGVLGAAAMLGFGLRLWLLEGVDDRGTALAVTAVLLLLSYAWLDAQAVVQASRARSVRIGGSSIALVLLAGALAILTQALVRTSDTTFDLTRDQRFSLSPHTVSVVADLQQDVTLRGFFPRDAASGAAFERLASAMSESSSHLRFTRVDPLRSPLEAERYGVTSESDTVVIEVGETRETLVRRTDETALANAILRVASGRQHIICWSTGHGEASPDEDGVSDSLTAAVLSLEAKNYHVRYTRLLNGPPEPDCETLVMARPRIDLLEDERDRLAAWLAAGGRALLLLEPGMVPHLASDLAQFGVGLADDVVLDIAPERRLMGMEDPSTFMVDAQAWTPHPISRALAGAVIFQGVRSVRPLDDTPGVAVRVLASGSPMSWAETTLENPEAGLAPNADEWAGDVSFAVAVEVTDPGALDAGIPRQTVAPLTPRSGGRLVVIGDSTFVSNQLVDLGSNMELFSASIAWLSDEEAQLAPQPAMDSERLELSALSEGLLAIMCLLLLPSIPLVFAVRAHWRRRLE